jgi:hypothetical protein
MRVLSLGAGVQSTALLILAARGDVPGLDAAIFADTGWEPAAVYEHLDRLEREVAAPAGIPIHRVSSGNIREDALDPGHRFASMPLYIRNADGGEGMGRRQCTSEYKLMPIRREIRTLLGATPDERGVPGRVTGRRFAETWVGISWDEQGRALGMRSLRYSVDRFPLLELQLTRADCEVINAHAGFHHTPKSACVGCPFHKNAQWRLMRDNDPEAWASAVDFDRRIRNGSARALAQGQRLRGEMYLHRSRMPLDEAPIDHVTSVEWSSRQGDLVAMAGAIELAQLLEEEGAVRSCSPWGCRIEETAGSDLNATDLEMS